MNDSTNLFGYVHQQQFNLVVVEGSCIVVANLFCSPQNIILTSTMLHFPYMVHESKWKVCRWRSLFSEQIMKLPRRICCKLST